MAPGNNGMGTTIILRLTASTGVRWAWAKNPPRENIEKKPGRGNKSHILSWAERVENQSASPKKRESKKKGPCLIRLFMNRWRKKTTDLSVKKEKGTALKKGGVAEIREGKPRPTSKSSNLKKKKSHFSGTLSSEGKRKGGGSKLWVFSLRKGKGGD